MDCFDVQTNTGYEFHGCPKCYKPTTFNVQHVNRINYLKRYLSNLTEIWECEWDQMVKESDELKQFIKNEDDIRPDL